MARTANHHFLPQFYLRNFASGKGRQATVQAIDLKQQKSFSPRVRNVGAKRNFNSAVIQGFPSDKLEAAVGETESGFSRSLQKIVAQTDQIGNDELSDLVVWMSFLASRNPRIRHGLGHSFGHLVPKVSTSNPIEHEQTRDGLDRLTDAEGRRVALHQQTEIMKLEVLMIRPVCDLLSRRSWGLKTPADSEYFVTCDHPLILFSHEEPTGLLDSRGFGSHDTSIIFPLSKGFVLTGEWRDESAQQRMTLYDTALINTIILGNAAHQIYSYGNLRKPRLAGAVVMHST